ncbi:MAG: YlmH/Sll1252 family protein [Anaerorhabdus sp.]
MKEDKKIFLSRIDDWVMQSEKEYFSVCTPFLSEDELLELKQYCKKSVRYTLNGGYEGAIRCKVIFGDIDKWSSDIICLVAKINFSNEKIEHRDVLGALMSLNIDRNQFGDIIIEENEVIIFTSNCWKLLVIEECTKIRNTNVKFTQSSKQYSREHKYEIISGFVKSERIDAIVACIISSSRSSVKELFDDQMIKVNGHIVKKITKVINENDIISIRKHGRFIYKGISKKSKKDRLLVEFAKYIS